MSSQSFVLQPGEERSIDLGGFMMTVKATSESTDGAFTLLEAAEPPHFGPPIHIHRDAAEAFYVTEGEYLIFIDDQESRCPAGSFVYIPAGVAHGFRVGDTPSKKLNLYVPQAMVGYFDELAEAIASGHVDDDHLSAIARRYGMEGSRPRARGLRVAAFGALPSTPTPTRSNSASGSSPECLSLEAEVVRSLGETTEGTKHANERCRYRAVSDMSGIDAELLICVR